MHLIVGGTGALGSSITRRLLSAGERVRVMTRSIDRAAELASLGAEVVKGDLLDRSSVARACEGAAAVFAVAHSIFGRGREASAYVDLRGNKELIDEAFHAGVRHFIYASVHDNGPAYRAVPFFRIKYEVEDHLKVSGLSYTILRPTAFMESHAHAFIGEPIVRKGKTVVFGKGNQPRNFVAADDVAAFAVRALWDPDLIGRTLTIGGPENRTNMDVVRLYERVSGKSAKVLHLPLGLLRAAMHAVRPFHPGLSQVIQAGILADTTDQRFDAKPLQDQFDIPMTRLEDWVAGRVERDRAADRSQLKPGLA